MSAPEHDVRLSSRDREILRDVVRTYILSGEPVSSRTVARSSRLGVSAATIRNAMADLEEAGFLHQPHTSAGRVPSASGLHVYIDTLMTTESLSDEERGRIEEELQASEGGRRLVETASQLLSRLTGQVGMVLTPAFGDTVLEAVDFLPLTSGRILCVIVSRDGFVENKLVEVDDDFSREELVRISNQLTELYRGQTLRAIREQLLARMREERAQVDRLLARSIALAARGLEGGATHDLAVEGASALLARGREKDIERVRRLLDAFGERQRLVELLSQCLDGRGVRVVIGDDSEVTSDLDLTLVARGYGGERPRGTLGILGPARMPYERIIPLVDFLGDALSKALEESARSAEAGR